MELVSVAAVDDTLAIGADGKLPWERLPADKRQYRERIATDPVILGRRTFESMRDDLPGSDQIVLSRSDREYDIETAIHAGSVEDAIDVATAIDAPTVYVIGGAMIYSLFQPHLDRMVLSRVQGSYDGDAYYPEWNDDDWELREETPFDRFTLTVWERTGEGP